ncbi:NADPH-dependent aldehyde reductase-like protein, chloroplastic [Salvia miltiorrhiza]|uniref:NADPH-dependent aldehyde reductase-like protein, chloroplastic n=1 Tax=Salvia miltiorrhiza TaxID=226208 RepID=UPI0025ACF36F|nr:NADPH-dependent aldehyde reductase-like protein, chloroplastic [Salvia miltiorrhiza]
MAPSTASADLHGGVAIVTGASRRIDRAIAIHLCSLGAKLVINYTSSSTQADLLAFELNAEATDNCPIAVAVKADVSNPEEVRSLFDRAEHEFKTPVHILINCAGVFGSQVFHN